MSSFQKRKQIPLPPGTTVSIHSKQPITSSGIPSLDHIIGGGLAIGSVILIEEDKFSVYSKVIAKYFLAEGIFSKHKTFLASLDDDPHELYKRLPSPCDEPIVEKSTEQMNQMRIAWRYNNLPQVDSEISRAIGHNFDLTRPIEQAVLDEHGGWDVWDGSILKSPISNIFTNPHFESLLSKISDLIARSKDSRSGEQEEASPCFRVCLTSLGSPLWYDNNFEADLCKFLMILKSLMRSTFGVCLMTVPMHLQQCLNDTLPLRIRNLVDYSIQLESFAGSEKETNPIFKEYHGLLNIKKLSALNTLQTFTPDTTDLAFKLRRRKFVIEKLHLPPELQEKEDQHTPSLACAGGPKKHLMEF